VPDIEPILEQLKTRGYRMTPQRRAILDEVMKTDGHISALQVVDRVKVRLPGVNASTVYRTLGLLEELGVVSHAHLGDGPEYHHADRDDHVHLICARCKRAQSLSDEETQPLKDLIAEHNGFVPDFTHFAVSGLCRDCQKAGAS
jgi:Fur family transcriptional regulator, ferric uptake regulator